MIAPHKQIQIQHKLEIKDAIENPDENGKILNSID